MKYRGLLLTVIGVIVVGLMATESVGAAEDKGSGIPWCHIVVGTAAGAATIAAAPLAISAAGFTAGGVVAGSVAAGVQSYMGTVAAGSGFAALQSAGVLGFSTSTNAILGTVGGGVTSWFCGD